MALLEESEVGEENEYGQPGAIGRERPGLTAIE